MNLFSRGFGSCLFLCGLSSFTGSFSVKDLHGPFKELLLRRGILFSESTDCDLCHGCIEDYQHDVVTCAFAKTCWMRLVVMVTVFCVPLCWRCCSLADALLRGC